MLEDALATAVHANRCAFTKALGATPGEVVFGRDMLVDLPIMVDLVRIQERRQLLIDKNLRRQNNKRREWNYAVGQQVMIKAVKPSKLDARTHGPYTIVQVYTNGTVDVKCNPHVVERVNIRCLIPYRRS